MLHEPHLALFVPNDNPLQFYEAIALFAHTNLAVNGAVYVEINYLFGKETQQLFHQYGFSTHLKRYCWQGYKNDKGMEKLDRIKSPIF